VKISAWRMLTSPEAGSTGPPHDASAPTNAQPPR
jgi:hypothetical protein